MFRKLFGDFARDIRGNFALATVMAIVPLMGGLAFAIDFTEMNRQRQAVLNALDASGIAAGRYISTIDIPEGLSDAAKAAYVEAATRTYAQDFFDANLESIIPSTAQLAIVMPNTTQGGGKLKLSASLKYAPIFFPVFNRLHTKTDNGEAIEIAFSAQTEIRLKNTLEVALVMDNSGSMSSSNRMNLLKNAATYLVDELAKDGKKILQVDKPVQVSLIPFSASVNVGPENDDESWLDTMGISPVHHENFDWSTMTQAANPDKWIQKVGSVYYKRGTGWNYSDETGVPVIADGAPATRLSLYQDMQVVTGRESVATERERYCAQPRWWGCKKYKWRDVNTYEDTLGRFSSWQGCVEARPYPHNVQDSAAVSGSPETLFVPMFAPDEPGNFWRDIDGDGDNDVDSSSWGYPNNYWVDSSDSLTVKKRQQDMRKYFMVKPMNASNSGSGDGPNHSCTTVPITPLVDVTKQVGLDDIKDAIDDMSPTGYTDVPQGIAWGWRSVSSKAPFTEGRPDGQNGNDKVIIVLTDGANTYRDLSNDSSLADNQSYYAAHGFTGMGYNGTSTTRLFMGTSGDVGKSDYSSGNYTDAHDEHMDKVCTNAKDERIIVFTVALDLNDSSSAAQALKKCASDSRFKRDDDGNPVKLYYNTDGSDLLNTFKEIHEELSNLRIVG